MGKPKVACDLDLASTSARPSTCVYIRHAVSSFMATEPVGESARPTQRLQPVALRTTAQVSANVTGENR